MKKNKRLLKLIDNFIVLSFDHNDNLIEESVRKFSKLLTQLPTSRSIPALSDYYRLLKEKIDHTTLLIQSPIELSSQQVDKIRNYFEKRHQVKRVNVEIDPSLFGGIKVKIGDMIYDNSVQRKILELKGVING